ncbi:C39 family peptidase [Lachnospiraceae bacterium 46-15]
MARRSDNYWEQGRSYERHLKRRRRMKQMRRIRRILVCAASLAIVLGAVWMLKGLFPFEAEEAGVEVSRTLPDGAVLKQDGLGSKPSPQKNAGVPYVKELLEMEAQEPRISEVVEKADLYPERVLKMLSKNIETLDFVLDYWDKKDVPCEESIGQALAEGEIPLLLQWDERWGYGAYGESMVAVSGCGPTCIAMVASGLTGRTDITPYTVASYSENNGFLTKELDTSWDLMTYGCQEFGVTGTMLGLDENAMVNTLSYGNPIICSMGPGDFTDNGHFIVLTGYENGMFQVNDPNSRIRSEKTWSYETLKNQIVNMWWYSLNE